MYLLYDVCSQPTYFMFKQESGEGKELYQGREPSLLWDRRYHDAVMDADGDITEICGLQGRQPPIGDLCDGISFYFLFPQNVSVLFQYFGENAYGECAKMTNSYIWK